VDDRSGRRDLALAIAWLTMIVVLLTRVPEGA
jgi:hypothetical protein